MFDYSVICTCTTINIQEGKKGGDRFYLSENKKKTKKHLTILRQVLPPSAFHDFTQDSKLLIWYNSIVSCKKLSPSS